MKRVKKKLKRYIAFLAVLIILVSITVTPAHASYSVTLQRVKAGIAAAILGLNTMITAVGAPVEDALDYIFSPNQDYYTYYDAWQDRPTIQIWPDYVTIDGVEYTDIWISNEAAEKFRVNAFDFLTEYSIASETNGTFASGVGMYDGLPIFSVGSSKQTQNISVPFQAGSFKLTDNTNVDNTLTSANWMQTRFNDNVTSATSMVNSGGPNLYPINFRFVPNNQLNNGTWQKKVNTGTYWDNVSFPVYATRFVNQPFDFDWVSQTIPADTPLPSDTGMMIRIPSHPTGSTRDIIDFVDDNPDFAEPGGTVVDFTLDPDVGLTLDDLFDIIMPLIPILNFGDINFIENHEAPIPPIPDVPIVDATIPQVVNPIINEITNYGDTITQQIPNIIETIPTIDDICNNIDTAPYHDLDTGLDHLPTVFLPFITDLRSALGIWHYVTEWLSQVSTTFSFITGCLVGTSIMTPIYAAIAGFMCIKVYRRMTS